MDKEEDDNGKRGTVGILEEVFIIALGVIFGLVVLVMFAGAIYKGVAPFFQQQTGQREGHGLGTGNHGDNK